MTVISSQPSTTIAVGADLATLINVFKVKPENQQKVVDLLVEATEDAMAKLPGFISANIHKSLDGEWVTNYAQWQSLEDFRAIFQNPTAREHMPRIGAVAESSPVLYNVCYTKMASSEPNAIIALDADLATLINVFKVKPENQQKVVDLLVEATEDAMAKLPGFISANIHKSLDGEWVTNYAQWQSLEDFRAIFQNPTAREHMPRIGAVAESSPVLYDVCYTKHS